MEYHQVLWKTPSVDRTATYRPGQKNCSLFPAKTLKACKIKIHRRTGGYSISPLWHAIFAFHPRVDVAFHPGISSLTCPRDQTINVVLITQKYQPYQPSTASFPRLMTRIKTNLPFPICLFRSKFYPLVIEKKKKNRRITGDLNLFLSILSLDFNAKQKWNETGKEKKNK